MIIYLGLLLPVGSSDLTRERNGQFLCSSIRSCSKWGLPSQPSHPGCWWALTSPFHPYHNGSQKSEVGCQYLWTIGLPISFIPTSDLGLLTSGYGGLFLWHFP